AAVVTYLLPGLRLFHEGQFEGRRIRPSMHLGRRDAEELDPDVRHFYERLLQVIARPVAREGAWQLCDCQAAWTDNPSWNSFIAFAWERKGDRRLLAAVNYGPTQGQCYVRLPHDVQSATVRLRDLLGPAQYERDGNDLAHRGLYLDMPPWG